MRRYGNWLWLWKALFLIRYLYQILGINFLYNINVNIKDESIVSSSSKFCLIADRLNGETIGGKDYNNVKKIQQNVINEFRQYCEIQLT